MIIKGRGKEYRLYNLLAEEVGLLVMAQNVLDALIVADADDSHRLGDVLNPRTLILDTVEEGDIALTIMEVAQMHADDPKADIRGCVLNDYVLGSPEDELGDVSCP